MLKEVEIFNARGYAYDSGWIYLTMAGEYGAAEQTVSVAEAKQIIKEIKAAIKKAEDK